MSPRQEEMLTQNITRIAETLTKISVSLENISDTLLEGTRDVLSASESREILERINRSVGDCQKELFFHSRLMSQ